LTAHFEVDFLARSQDLLQADEITLELVALRSFAELEGERSWDLRCLLGKQFKSCTIFIIVDN
jgi:hypothetical protein